MTRLFAGRYLTTTGSGQITGGTLLEAFDAPENIGIRWSITGEGNYGIERIEVTVPVKSEIELYQRMNDHFGGVGVDFQRLAVFDNLVDKCVSGFITGVRPNGSNSITYIAKGPGWNHSELYGPTYTSYTPTDTTSDQLIKFLEDDVVILEDDMSNIEETSTPLGPWQHPDKFGMYPSEFIEFAKKASDSNGEIWDYYCLDRRMDYGNLRDWTPYFRNRGNRTTVDWKVSVGDLARLTLDRDVSEFKSSVIIWYGTYQGTATGGSAVLLNDTGATFLDGRFTVGDEVKNITDGSISRIRAINSNTQLSINTLSGGSSNVFVNGDTYSIIAKTLWNFEEDGNLVFAHANRRVAEHRTELDSTQADQYAKALHDFFKVPVQSAAFVISSPWIRDANGVNRPLWAPIFEAGGIIQITNLFPAAVVSLAQATNNLDTFFITSLDYDYTSNQLRVGVNVPDSRLDARLAAIKILGSAGIRRAPTSLRR